MENVVRGAHKAVVATILLVCRDFEIESTARVNVSRRVDRCP